MGRAEKARSVLRPILRNQSPSARVAQKSNPEIVLRQGEFGFIQLASWRDQVGEELLDVEGVIFIDVDEAKNRLVIGIQDAGAGSRAAAKLAQRAIPAAATLLENTAPPVFESTLRDPIRPLQGGIQIAFSNYNCTLGWVTTLNDGTQTFLTNSHCTDVYWDNTGTAFYQPDNSPTYFVGTEYRDPNSKRCGFFSVDNCRYADVAAVAIDRGTTFQRGYVARPTYDAYGRGGVGSIEINANNPQFQVVGKASYPSTGQYMDKVGRTTGWTYGEVSKTCVDVRIETYRNLLCQEYAKYGSAGGDSGSPVFLWHGDNTITGYGIHWGSTGDGAYAIFSPMGGIEKDVGSIVITP